jgi:hypothetical protein
MAGARYRRLPRPSYDLSLWALRTWLDSWAGIGRIAVGMATRASTFNSPATTSAFGARRSTRPDGALAEERVGHEMEAHAVMCDAEAAEEERPSPCDVMFEGGSRPRKKPARHGPKEIPRVASVRRLSRSLAAIGSPVTLTVQAKDKLIDFDASRPGCGRLRKSPLSRLFGAFCLNAERTSAFHYVGVHRSPVGFHWPPPSPWGLHGQCQTTSASNQTDTQSCSAFGVPPLDSRVIVRLVVSSRCCPRLSERHPPVRRARLDATFYIMGIRTLPTSATGIRLERTPWHATQRRRGRRSTA